MIQKVVVVGLGETGWSVLRHMHGRCDLVVMDEAEAPRYAMQARALLGSERVKCGAVDLTWCAGADAVVFSPGFSVCSPFYQALQQRGVCLMSDVDVFMKTVNMPVLGVTGTNGKSTLVRLLAHVARAMGERVFEGGNLGTPCLDGLAQQASLNILELSSFQLAHAQPLPLDMAVLLNLADDHASWHGHIDHYHQSKLKILAKAKQAWVVGEMASQVWSRHAHNQPAAHVHVMPNATAWSGQTSQGPWHVDAQRLPFGLDAALVAVTLSVAAERGWHQAQVLQSLYAFKGLAHRLEVVGDFRLVRWINDSKATNADAVLYACRRLAALHQRVVLILAGKPKGWTPQALLPHRDLFKAWVVVGDHAEDFPDALPDVCYQRCETVAEAVSWAHCHTQAQDCVLFSPGGASFDQYQSFADRGNDFKQCVRDLHKM